MQQSPWTYGRYGVRQWAGPLPWSRNIVKDPFAMLSLHAIVEHTQARPILIYRHPAAVLASYRRMGWTADVSELQQVVDTVRTERPLDTIPLPPPPDAKNDAKAMAWFWLALHELALMDMHHLRGLTVVAHSDVAKGGTAAARVFMEHLDLKWNAAAHKEMTQATQSTNPSRSQGLHNFDRSPAAVADSWKASLNSDEIGIFSDVCLPTLHRLEKIKIPVSSASDEPDTQVAPQ